jgi:hypothetical protein
MSLPAVPLSRAISSARSPRAICESGQSARSMPFENTTLAIAFIGAA